MQIKYNENKETQKQDGDECTVKKHDAPVREKRIIKSNSGEKESLLHGERARRMPSKIKSTANEKK